MAGAVGYVGDEVVAGSCRVAEQAVRGFDDELDQVDVLPFVAAADVVGLAGLAAVENDIDGAGVVFYGEPVAHVLALAVDGEGETVQDVVNAEGNQLLRELAGAVVVRAVGHQGGHAVGVMVGADKVVAGGFGSAVGTVGRIRSGFPE